MATTQLTPYLLDSSLIGYVTAIAREALQSSNPVLQEQTRKRAMYALQFFLDVLDPSVGEERKQLETFRSYRAALDDPDLAAKVTQSFPSSGTESSTKEPAPKVFDLTPAQRVLSLPDTLETIFSHIPLLTQSDRTTYRQAALTSHAFYNAGQPRLWRRPRRLNTVDQQMRFAFGTAISGADGDNLGNYVKQLRIKITVGGWNLRLVEKIAILTPGVIDLTLQWSGAGNSANVLPPICSMVASLHKVLSSFPNLTRLYLADFEFPSPTEEDLQYPVDAHVPFSKLEFLQLYDFHGYWEPMLRGLGPTLKELDISQETIIDEDEIVELLAKLTSLTALCLPGLEARHVRSIVETHPNLEKVELVYLDEQDDEFAAYVVQLLASLRHLKQLRFNVPIGPAQLKVLANSSSPLEDIELTLQANSKVVHALIKLLNANSQTLETIVINYEGRPMAPSDKLVEALAGIPRLETILVGFPSPQRHGHGLSPSSVAKLLKQCPKLRWSNSLEELVKGNPLYENEFRSRLERERDELYEKAEESAVWYD